ncbi:MAG: hypothetical protein HQK67_07820, partial [Desulfamplus sp.]|nr:hypothetical protein [Desulfamplus sp.]
MKQSVSTLPALLVTTLLIISGFISYLFGFNFTAHAQAEAFTAGEKSATGDVRLHLNEYNRLMDIAREPKKKPRPAPAGFSIGNARVNVTVSGVEDKALAIIHVALSLNIVENEWVLIPVLPAGTPLKQVTVNGNQVQLITRKDGLFWSVQQSGNYQMELEYAIDAIESESGYTLLIPLPKAANMTFNAAIPETNADVGVIPSAGISISNQDNTTLVQAVIPACEGVQLSWRFPHKKSYAVSRANYEGQLLNEAVVWTGEFELEVFGNEPVNLKLMPNTITLSDVLVDGQKSAIFIEDAYFTTTITGIGKHNISLDFLTTLESQNVARSQNSAPAIHMPIPLIPISHFKLILPGKKELSVTPATSVVKNFKDNVTESSFYIPMTDQVSFTWTEAIPEEVKAELQANATFYHTVYAEEGVLYTQVMARYEITRGETNTFEIELPDNIQINRIVTESGEISDWRIAKGQADDPSILTIFVNQKVKESFNFDIFYDQSINTNDVRNGINDARTETNDARIGTDDSHTGTDDSHTGTDYSHTGTDDSHTGIDDSHTGIDTARNGIDVPLVRARNIHRQRGMVALLSSKESTLKPVEEKDITKVGENQLPAFVRQSIDKIVAHTYKYVAPPKLTVQVVPPERKEGKFDAMVYTLISLGDVTMSGSATIDLSIKSGNITELFLELPPKVNLLSL